MFQSLLNVALEWFITFLNKTMPELSAKLKNGAPTAFLKKGRPESTAVFVSSNIHRWSPVLY